MCIVHGDPENPILKDFLKKDMSLENARKILDQVMTAKPMVGPSLWSEPLMAKNFKEHVVQIKERGMAISINTNGLLLRPELAEFFVEVKLDSICFSIDAVTVETLYKVRGVKTLPKLHKAVEMMLEARGDNLLPRIGVSFTVQPTNEHECEQFIAEWTPKVDFVRIGELFEQGHFPSVAVQEERHACPSLYSTMAIHANGNVSYCCLDGFGETSLGNVFESSVEDVWNGEKFNEVRLHHENGEWDKVPFCKNCDRWATYDVEERVENGILIRRSAEFTYYNKIERLSSWTAQLMCGLHASQVTTVQS